MKKVSIIIPNYNCRQYVGACLDSVMRQNYRDKEIIIVDDGSVDGSQELIRKLIEKNSCARLYSVEHLGVNATRKFGLLKATGDYVMFVDADDFLEPNAIEALAKEIEKNDVDIVKFGAKYYPDGGEVMPILKREDSRKVLTQDEMIALLATSDKLNSLWGKMYRKNIFDDVLAFDYDIGLGEDLLISMEVCKRIDKMLVIDEALYNYRNDNDSITRSREKYSIVKNVQDRVCVTLKMLEYINDNVVDEKLRIMAIYKQISAIWGTMKQLALVNDAKKEELEVAIDGIRKIKLRDADICNLRQYVNNLDLPRKLKNGMAVRALAEKDCDKVWRAFRRYRALRKIARRGK